MPTKTRTKKLSKTPSRVSNSDDSQSPRQPPMTPPPDSGVGEDDFLSIIEEASNRYPYLIGKSAFVGRVTNARVKSSNCRVWLSESSMLAHEFNPGDIVSVALAPERGNVLNDFPISSLRKECGRQFGVDYGDLLTDEAGNYFALASVFSSNKELKNGVQLSMDLSYTLGCPTSGRAVFIFPLKEHLCDDLLNGSGKLKTTELDSLRIYNCKELFLELASILSSSNVVVSSSMVCSRKIHDCVENGNLASPRTPLYQSKMSLSSSRLSASPNCDDSVSSLTTVKSSSDHPLIKEALSDASVKNLLQIVASKNLSSRCLLRGNLVSMPFSSDLCTFHVRGGKGLFQDGDSPVSNEVENCGFRIDKLTKVFINDQSTMVLEMTEKTVLPDAESENLNVRAKAGHNALKLGGLSKEYSVLKDIIIASSLKGTLSSLGVRTMKGVLLHGPPGTGKTSLAQLCAHDAGVNLFYLNGPEIISQYYGESEQALHKVFEEASQAAPAVIFIDELDAIAPARKDGGEELSQRIVATLLNLMDGISRADGPLIIASTNRPDSIEPALRRPGRLDREIEIGVPSSNQRLDILLAILSDMEHSLSDLQVQHLAMVTHGFVGADLAALCNEAAFVCIRRYHEFEKSTDCISFDISTSADEGYSGERIKKPIFSEVVKNVSRDSSHSATSSNSTSPKALTSVSSVELVVDNEDFNDSSEIKCKLKVVFEDFEIARMKVRPSAMREVVLEVPKVKWEDVGGQGEVKTQLMEAVEWPQKHQDAFRRIGTRPPTGVLMFGPPGCSKTLMARAVASEAGLNFLAVKGPELFSKWVGESEKAVRSLFAKARANAPSIIFFDEIDGLAVIRGKESDGASVSDRVMSQLLVELDGLHQRVDVTVIAATNRPDKIDPALLRPGRFDRLLYVGPPNEFDRHEIFGIHLRKIPCGPDISTRKLASLTQGFTGADISLICKEAALAAIEESLEASEINMQHFETAIRQVKPSKTEPYQELSSRFQRLVCSTSQGVEVGDCQLASQSKWPSIWPLIKSIVLPFSWLPAYVHCTLKGFR